MKKIIFTFLLTTYFVSCKEKTLNHYHGVVVDSNSIPLSGVLVKTRYSKPEITTTNENGYFKLVKSPNTITSLIFSKEGYLTDTIKSVYAHGGENIDYRFINKEIDTIPLRKITLPNNGYN